MQTKKYKVGFSEDLLYAARYEDRIICGVEASKARSNEELLDMIEGVLSKIIEESNRYFIGY